MRVLAATLLGSPRRGASLLCLCAAACGAGSSIITSPADSQSRTIQASVGQEIRITLGNVGPAQYESPPQLSSNAIRYLNVEVIPPFTPAGPTQQFRFQAVGAGAAVIHFRRLLRDSVVFVVEDTIQVR